MADADGLDRIREWLDGRKSVRAALLTGSRAVEDAPVDELSDFDVLLFLESGSPLLESQDWVRELGPVLVMLPEEGTILGRTIPTRLVQYEGAFRVDFGLAPAELLEELAGRAELPALLDAGYRVLLDRDGLAGELPDPTGRGHVPDPPTEGAFLALVNEFWWETLYVAKYLARDEILPARYSHEVVIRYECLIPLLEWRVQVGRGWSVAVGLNGKGLPELLDDEERRGLGVSLAGSTVKESWRGLFATISLFRKAARLVAEDLEYEYPEKLDRGVETRIRKIRGG